MKGIQTPIVPMLQRGNALGDAPRHRSALRMRSMGTIGVRIPIVYHAPRMQYQVLNLRTRPSSSLDRISRLLESARAESESSAINCASPWIWLMCRLMSSAT